MHNNNFKTDLGKIKGLGSARNGTKVWWLQRITALALIPLTVWFVVTILKMVSATNNELSSIIESPFNMILSMLFIIVGLYHGTLGMKEIIEDYIHCEPLKFAINIFLEFIKFITIAAGLMALITLHLSVFIGN